MASTYEELIAKSRELAAAGDMAGAKRVAQIAISRRGGGQAQAPHNTGIVGNIEQAGSHRLNKWENGWNENFDRLQNSESVYSSVVPVYYGKYPEVRWKQNFILPTHSSFELNILNTM